MEIRIRTAEEFHADHVTIEITGSGAEIRQVAESRVYTQAEIDQYQTNEEMHLEQIGKLRGRVSELEEKVRGYDEDRHTERNRADRVTREHSTCAGKLELREKDADMFRAQRNELERRVAELEEGRQADHREIVELRRQRDEANLKFSTAHVCTGGCDGDQHVAMLGRQALAKLENDVAELTRRIDNTRVILSNPEVTRVCEMTSARGITFLSREIGKALDTLA